MSWGWFLGGTLFGSVGLKALSTKEAKKVYSYVVSYGLDAKDYIMETAEGLKEGWDDIYSEAKDLKADRDAEKEIKADIIEDTSSKTSEGTTKRSAAKRTSTRNTAAKRAGTRKK